MMSHFNESRRVSFSTHEINCRYLSIDLPLSPRNPSYTGKFGQELKGIGIEKFPFEITLSDLILSGTLSPSLYVALPKKYFEDWTNFPECPQSSSLKEEGLVGMYARQSISQCAAELHDLLHPYDGQLKLSFKEKFQSDVPESFLVYDHPCGNKYISAEAYLPYWQIYALAGNFHKYRHAEHFLSPEVGRHEYPQLIKPATTTFIQKYGHAFDRLSWYKTIVASATHSASNFTRGELIDLAQKHSNITVELLKEDLRLLLELDAGWHTVIQQNGCAVLEKARSSLSKDIYLVYEQLRLLGQPAGGIFEEFTTYSIGALAYTPLHDVLEFEGYGFKKSFTSLGSHYCAPIQKWGYDCTEDVFDSLIQVTGFDAWIRAFHDLHESINTPNQQPVSFKQNRIVDALIVMSVRTEIVLREMFRATLADGSDLSIVAFLKNTMKATQDNAAKIIETACNEIQNKTKLNDRPVDLFRNIEETNINSWSKEKNFFLRSLLKFITARNYFAHHAYKDDEINAQTNSLPREILESLLATLLFFQKNKKAGEITN